MFWLTYFPVKSHLSLFIVRHFSFLIWYLSQSLSFTQALPISLLSIILLFLTNILLKLALLPHLSFTLKICHLTLRFCSLLLIPAIVIFSFEYFSIFPPRYSLCILTDLFLFVFQWYSITYQCQLSLHSGSKFCVEYFRVWETIYITTNTAEVC